MLQEFRKPQRLMGNAFEITVVDTDERQALEHIDAAIAEIQRIEQLLTTYKEDSQTNLVNRNAGVQPVKVDAEMFNLIERSIRISQITDGYFDISYGGIDKRLWNFDKEMKELPDPGSVKEHLKLVNYRNILLDPEKQTVFLKEKGMRIGFGGIGKGYAAEMGKRLLQQRGVQSGVVNASGDLTVWGSQADGKPWTIGIANPDNARLPFSYLNITDTAVATSGNYEKYVMIGGKRYSHTINPKTGIPVSGVKSVTIICPNAEIADAMATPVSIMGIDAALNLINQIQQVECIIIDDANRIYSSKKINLK
ncbi:FAD:protein FMN transferase [Elizabethkingia anophelis]|jgi:thiamine biosynthesis lipoprotein|uniref:FAD:protein FMN transferase n=2 Tax=Bacteroidota TaxID=976 RepID=A0A318UN64_9SPHI|nr:MULTISPECIES: FAD:protein FMN transferase [Bacteroidota]MDV2466337.1 FAD:protein FMN transferase [Elizabethkingia anophelis]OJV56421.1 MAG: thiamine biosynthesis protein ApbE [Bacteroidetes bacterium 43-16]MDV3725042.1 FAD:protein FMN transferase [Elizabethkingia anophelis]MDV3730563.1 FAD:protein FMN transferase [Elizabethkingia anophelis]MDV3745447.1 FAD:protein FMN transferase [Elizabethkingia anophelis]